MKTINAHQLDPRSIHSDRVAAFTSDGIKIDNVSRQQAKALLEARVFYLITTDTVVQIEPGTEVQVINNGVPSERFIA
jgi:hypothetical protein